MPDIAPAMAGAAVVAPPALILSVPELACKSYEPSTYVRMCIKRRVG